MTEKTSRSEEFKFEILQQLINLFNICFCMLIRSITFLTGCNIVERVAKGLTHHFLSYLVIDMPKRFTIAVDETFIPILVVLYPTTSGALECNFEVVMLNSKSPLIGIFLLDNKALALKLLDKILKILKMILPLRTSPHKADLTFIPLKHHIPRNQNILKDPLRRNCNLSYFINRISPLHNIKLRIKMSMITL